jgi:hypothetical protein
MNGSRLVFAVLSLAIFQTACSSTPDDDPCAGSDDPACATCTPDRATFDEEVKPLVESYCGSCHGETPSFGAPMSLLSYDDLVSDGGTGRIVDHIVTRLDDASMPPVGMPRPPPEVTQAIMSWASCGQKNAPDSEGLISTAPPYLSPEEPPAGLEQVDLLANGFALGVDELDRYRCFVFDVAEGEDKFIRRFETVIDDSRVVHHIVLLRDAEGSAPATDYDCLGGMPLGSEYLYAWAPGQGAFQFPEGGLRMKAGERFVMQIHYNNGSHVEDVSDDSGVKLYVGPAEGTEYGQVAVGALDFDLPPNKSTDVKSSCEILEPTQVLAGMPHMHRLGDSFDQKIVRASGDSESVIVIHGWEFETQLYYSLPVELAPGDRLETTCRFMNSTSSTVESGPLTDEEMCFNFMYVTPPPPSRYCDDTDDSKPTDVDYAPGVCAPDDAPASAPLTSGIWIEGDAPTLEGGTIPDGQWVLDETTFYVSQASTPIGQIDLEKTFYLARGRAFTSAGRLTIDNALDVYIKAVEGPVFGGPFENSVGGPYTTEGGVLSWSPDCPADEDPSEIDYEVDGDKLTIGFISDDVPGAALKQRFVFKKER